jgi:hypothetical protein
VGEFENGVPHGYGREQRRDVGTYEVRFFPLFYPLFSSLLFSLLSSLLFSLLLLLRIFRVVGNGADGQSVVFSWIANYFLRQIPRKFREAVRRSTRMEIS